jgi:hypothetical protein
MTVAASPTLSKPTIRKFRALAVARNPGWQTFSSAVSVGESGPAATMAAVKTSPDASDGEGTQKAAQYVIATSYPPVIVTVGTNG